MEIVSLPYISLFFLPSLSLSRGLMLTISIG